MAGISYEDKSSDLPPNEDDVVISGISGCFPKSKNMYEFIKNLRNKTDMVSDYTRWTMQHPELPKRSGLITDENKLDVGFFGVHPQQVAAMCPTVRLLLEKTVEAVMDAGVSPQELRGTKTNVYVSALISERENYWLRDCPDPGSFGAMGLLKMMIANKISHFLKLNGASYNVDTACSSSLSGFVQAYESLMRGDCEFAIVTSSNMVYSPIVTLQFVRLGVQSKDGICKSFDDSANGYVRAEAACAMFLQKSRNAKRIYCYVVHAKCNNDGFKQEGITFPSSRGQGELYEVFYKECGVDPKSVVYIEPHGTGTRVGDVEELNAIDKFFVPGRSKPLLIGTVKSNMGHSEAVSGLSGVAKIIAGFETGFIYSNLWYQKPREGIPGLKEGRLSVVTDHTPWPRSTNILAGTNSFGFGGANAHVLLKSFDKTSSENNFYKNYSYHILCVSGRTEECVTTILNDVSNRKPNAEFIHLVNEAYKKDIPENRFRGYGVYTIAGETSRSIEYLHKQADSLWVLFCSFGNKWSAVVKELSAISVFKVSIQRIYSLLIQRDKHLINSINGNSKNFEDTLGNFILYLALSDLMQHIGIKAKYVVNISGSNLLHAYLDKRSTLEEVLTQALHQDIEHNKVIKVTKPSEMQEKFPQCVAVNGDCNDDHDSANHKLGNSFMSDINGNATHTNYSGSVSDTLSFILEDTTVFLVGQETCLPDSFAKFDERTINFKYDEEHSALETFLSSLGSLYVAGHNLDVTKIYPDVSYPVPRGTPMLSPLIKWEHSVDWNLRHHNDTQKLSKTGSSVVSIDVQNQDFEYLMGHNVDGRNLFPATGYLFLVWETIAQLKNHLPFDVAVVFEHVKFRRAVTITKGETVDFEIAIRAHDGYFEVNQGLNAIVTGYVHIPNNITEMKVLPTSYRSTACNEYTLLNQRDVYKELRLRGYNYSGLFKSICEYDPHKQAGMIQWYNNWTAFMDNMLQLQILTVDSRNLYVPTAIQMLKINGPAHLQYIHGLGDDPVVPVYWNGTSKTIRGGSIEFTDVKATSIPRQKVPYDPVLEKYVFVPNETILTTEESMRINAQVILENEQLLSVKTVEIFDDDKMDYLEPLGPLISKAFQSLPLIKADIVILSKKLQNVRNATVVPEELSVDQSNCTLMVVTGMLSNPKVSKSIIRMAKCSYLLSRENRSLSNSQINCENLEVLTIHTTDEEKFYLLRVGKTFKHPAQAIEISSDLNDLNWLPKLKQAIRVGNNEVVIYAQNQTINGIMGLYNCLHREPGGNKVKCVFTFDGAPVFNSETPFYQTQLKKNFSVNVYRNGKWGTFRHLLLNTQATVRKEHCFANVTTKGDLSSFAWIEGPLSLPANMEEGLDETIVHVYYAALNFRDIMTVTGRLPVDVVESRRTKQECVQGFEYAGRTAEGTRVVGMSNGSLSNLVRADKYMMMKVPDGWSLEDAATVMAVYSTVLYAFKMKTDIRRGQSILIHAGSGGVGQAAITVALHHGLTVYTTVGTKEKREFLKKQYPELDDSRIGYSRDTSFERFIMRQTKGKGVDYVLNSLSEEKLIASIKCLANDGCFLEIGKFDLSKNNSLSLEHFARNITYHGVMLDSLFDKCPREKTKLMNVLREGIRDGYVKPLTRTVFDKTHLEEAFRYMAAGKHIGKVLVNIRKEEDVKTTIPMKEFIEGKVRYCCLENCSYVITGGLGGFGLELADWLILRGAKYIVLSSRKGIRNGYQNSRIRLWKSYGVETLITTADITTKEGCRELIEGANQLAPVAGVFNLSVVLEDGVVTNQTEEKFGTVFGPKAIATKYLDDITRNECPNLRDFVVFSSVSCGRGNAGQTNYGMANSIMERICEQRKTDGFPATAIQWGAIGEVGLVAEMKNEQRDIVIGGTLEQKLSSCFEVLDVLLRQNEPIVSSMVVAEKQGEFGTSGSMMEITARIIGLRDLKTISHQATLAELGMDSMMAAEIQQLLEREWNLILSPQEIRVLTFNRLQELNDEDEYVKHPIPKNDKYDQGLDFLFQGIGNELLYKESTVRLPSLAKETDDLPNVFFIPGIEGSAVVFEKISAKLNCQALCMQHCGWKSGETIKDVASNMYQDITSRITSEDFTIVAFSFGSLIALEVVHLLELNGYTGRVILIDGSPDVNKILTKQFTKLSEKDRYHALTLMIISYFSPTSDMPKIKEKINQCSTREQLIQAFLDSLQEKEYSDEFLKKCLEDVYNKIDAILAYDDGYLTDMHASFVLFKPTTPTVTTASEDYGLSKYTSQPIKIMYVEGNHRNITENTSIADYINDAINIKAGAEQEIE